MYKIITDSASNLTEDIIKKYNIEIISYTYTVDNEAHKCFEEGVDDEIEGRLYYERMRAGADVKTSLLSPADIEEVFEKYMKEGYDILFITISSKLSGTYQSGLIASELMQEMYAERKCIVVDSMSASLGEGFLAIKASELRDEGCTIDEAAQWIYDNRLRMRHIFTVDDLKYLKKGGRISSSVSLVGTVLNVKPILIATDEGAIGFSSLVREERSHLMHLLKIILIMQLTRRKIYLELHTATARKMRNILYQRLKMYARRKRLLTVIMTDVPEVMWDRELYVSFIWEITEAWIIRIKSGYNASEVHGFAIEGAFWLPFDNNKMIC